jgi:hypothetical protein
LITYLDVWQEIHGHTEPYIWPVLRPDLGRALGYAVQIGAPAITSIVVRKDKTLTDEAKQNIRDFWEKSGQPIDHDLERFIVNQQRDAIDFVKRNCATKTGSA